MEKINPEQFAEVFHITEPEESTEQRMPITIWIPIEHKAKYDLIQVKSKHKFGKFLREVIKKSIDRVDIEKNAA